MQAIILAAGMGKRLKELTQNNPKCMVKVNGVTLIERLLRQLETYKLTRIVVVVGYEGQKLLDYIASLGIQTPVVSVDNPIYDKTNNIYSLFLAKDYLLKEDTLLFESDLIFEDSAIEAIVRDPRPTLALVDKFESWMDGTCVRLNGEDDIIEFIPGKKVDFFKTDDCYKTVNVYKFSKQFSKTHYVPFLKAYSAALGDNEYYEQVLKVIAMLSDPQIKAKRLTGQLWYEIDDLQDLDIASSLFAPSQADRAERLKIDGGGCWRYPKLLDFSHDFNPYFPPARLADEMVASFSALMTQASSATRLGSLLVAKNFGVRQNYVAVANGAEEFIRSLKGHIAGQIGVVHPAEEYPAFSGRKTVFVPQNGDFAYDADELIAFFEEQELGALLLANPDGLSGNFLKQTDVAKLISWTKKRGIKLILDETFVDFAENGATLLQNDRLAENPHLIVLKSISQCYGVSGLRLCVLAGGDTKLIECIKGELDRLNSFAEFFMQIMEKYRGDYDKSLVRLRQERERFLGQLACVKGLRAIPSQGNCIMLELESLSAKHVTEKLLAKNIFVKDLTGETGGAHICVAVRCTEDNDKIVIALREVLAES